MATTAKIRPTVQRKANAPARIRTSQTRRVDKPKRSVLLTVLVGIVLVYSLVPLLWLVINSTKSQETLFNSFGLWFGSDFDLWSNITETLSYDGGIFVRWLANTVLYVVLGAGGATFLAVLGGYALAKFNFPGKKAVFAVVIGAVADRKSVV